MYASKTVQKALALLELIADEPRPLGGIARATARPRATVHRLLSTLVDLGYVRYDRGDRLYRLGFKLLRLGRRAESQSELVRIARPWLERLRDATDETAHLMVVDGLEGVYVDIAEPRRGFHFWTPVGTRCPLHAGASMKTLMAFLPRDRSEAILSRRSLPVFTRATTTNPVKIRAALRRIRARGYGVSFGETQEGAAGVGAPIRDHRGDVVAGISAVGAAGRFTKARLPFLIAEVSGAADRVSRDLGFSAAPTPARAMGAE